MINASNNGEFELSRFIEAQDASYKIVVDELKRGKKQSHWMWYIFPQIYGLGISVTSKYFSIKSIEEARAYTEHSLLGTRLIECTSLVVAINNRSAKDIFGFPDCLKFQSSMTLFSVAAQNPGLYKKALNQFYGDEVDRKTMKILRSVL